MKIAATNSTHPRVIPAIPLERESQQELTKANLLSFKLRSVPADVASAQYSLTIPIFDTGLPEQFFLFLRNFKKVVIGQGIGTGPNQYALFR